jgi:hypothetical protein
MSTDQKSWLPYQPGAWLGNPPAVPAAEVEASGSDDARLQAAYAEGRKDEHREWMLLTEDDFRQDYIDARRYRWLRSRPLDAIQDGGVFAGKVPDNVVLNGEDLDAAIDAASLAEATERGKQIAAGLKLE